jgi:hypothetical protein
MKTKMYKKFSENIKMYSCLNTKNINRMVNNMYRYV